MQSDEYHLLAQDKSPRRNEERDMRYVVMVSVASTVQVPFDVVDGTRDPAAIEIAFLSRRQTGLCPARSAPPGL